MLLDRFESLTASLVPTERVVEMALRVALDLSQGTRAAVLLRGEGQSWEPFLSSSRPCRMGNSTKDDGDSPAAQPFIDLPIVADDAVVGLLRVEGAAVMSPRVLGRLRRCAQVMAEALQPDLQPRKVGGGFSP